LQHKGAHSSWQRAAGRQVVELRPQLGAARCRPAIEHQLVSVQLQRDARHALDVICKCIVRCSGLMVTVLPCCTGGTISMLLQLLQQPQAFLKPLGGSVMRCIRGCAWLILIWRISQARISWRRDLTTRTSRHAASSVVRAAHGLPHRVRRIEDLHRPTAADGAVRALAGEVHVARRHGGWAAEKVAKGDVEPKVQLRRDALALECGPAARCSWSAGPTMAHWHLLILQSEQYTTSYQCFGTGLKPCFNYASVRSYLSKAGAPVQLQQLFSAACPLRQLQRRHAVVAGRQHSRIVKEVCDAFVGRGCVQCAQSGGVLAGYEWRPDLQ
jgi:hypothetical protein